MKHFNGGLGRMCEECLYTKLNEDFTLNSTVCDSCMKSDKKKESIYTLTYAIRCDEGKLTQHVIQNQTKEECEIIYGNLIGTLELWLMELDK